MNFLDGQLAVLEQTVFIKQIMYDFGLPSLNIGEARSAFTVIEHNQVRTGCLIPLLINQLKQFDLYKVTNLIEPIGGGSQVGEHGSPMHHL